MILMASVAFACRSGDLQSLARLLDPANLDPWLAGPWLLWTRRTRLIIVRTAPFASAITIALLFLRLRRPRPTPLRLARQPGFIACLVASLVLFVGGSMTFSGVSRNASAPWRGLRVSDFFPYLLQPFGRAEVGFAVAAAWLVLILGGRWRPETSWIDRWGCAMGAYWIMLVPVVRLGEYLHM